jgi:hypothetical protein
LAAEKREQKENCDRRLSALSLIKIGALNFHYRDRKFYLSRFEKLIKT